MKVDLDGRGKSRIQTPLGFFTHMLELFAKHSGIDIYLKCKGDVHVDEHHTVEDTAITLAGAILKALGDKKGIARYGFFASDGRECFICSN